MVPVRRVIDDLNKEEVVTRDMLQATACMFQATTDNILLAIAPRVGKTRMALSILKPFEKVLVISNTILIKKNWEKEIDNWNFPIEYKSICYQSLHKVKNDYDVIIIDEEDVSLTEATFEILKHFTPKRWVGLTGTLTFRGKVLWKKLVGTSFDWTITTDRAISWGILSPPDIILFGLNLQDDKTKRNQVYHIGKDKKRSTRVVRWGDHFKHLKGRTENLAVQVTEREWVDMLDADQDKWKQMQKDIQRRDELRDKLDNRIYLIDEEVKEYGELDTKLKKFSVPSMIIENNIKRLGLERKKFFALRKNRFIKKIIQHFQLENSRVLIFANSIPQAEWIDEETAIHSGKDSAHLLEAFNRGEIDRLCAVGMIDRGVDLYRVDTTIMIQVGGSEAKNKQQSSRNMLDVSPRLIIVYYMDSQDQIYVDKFVSQFNKQYIKRINPYGKA